MHDAQAKQVTGGGDLPVRFDKIPDTCPVCQHAMLPFQMCPPGHKQGVAQGRKQELEIVYRCPRNSCASFFIARYEYNAQRQGTSFLLYDLLPKTLTPAVFDPSIAQVSPDFVKIYNQALTAESLGLDEIAGVGFRKALEFLIKDYCISKEPLDTEEIKRTLLGSCIKKHVADPNVKRCAERAVWLGNDETHYVRLWRAHDIADLKTLIRLTVNWIVNEVLTEQYFAAMPSRTSV